MVRGSRHNLGLGVGLEVRLGIIRVTGQTSYWVIVWGR